MARAQNAAAVAPLLVEQPSGVGEAGVVVERGVQVDVAGRGGGIFGPLGGLVLGRAAAVDLQAAAVGDPAELLHIDVDHVPWPGPFIPDYRFAEVSPRTSRSGSREIPRRTRTR